MAFIIDIEFLRRKYKLEQIGTLRLREYKYISQGDLHTLYWLRIYKNKSQQLPIPIIHSIICIQYSSTVHNKTDIRPRNCISHPSALSNNTTCTAALKQQKQ